MEGENWSSRYPGKEKSGEMIHAYVEAVKNISTVAGDDKCLKSQGSNFMLKLLKQTI